MANATEIVEDECVLDSRCSFHITSNRDWFLDYREIDRGKVIMGNKSTSKVVGIGSIKLKLEDGTMKILSNVKHVPELKRNLISLRVLVALTR